MDDFGTVADRVSREAGVTFIRAGHPIVFAAAVDAGRLAAPRGFGQVAQLVEQRTENPCVGGSIPPLATL